MPDMQIIADISQAELLFASLAINKQKNILRAAVRNALNPILQEAKRNFKGDFSQLTGGGFASLGLQMYRREIGAAIGAIVSGGKKGWYARFLDTGTKERFQKKTGKSAGKINPSLFFNSVASSRIGQAGSDLETSVIWALNKAISRGAI